MASYPIKGIYYNWIGKSHALNVGHLVSSCNRNSHSP